MKLYSHSQLIRTTLICVVAAVLLTAAVCIKISKNKEATAAAESAEITEVAAPVTEQTAVSIEDSVGFLEQNPASVINVASTSSSYTQEEAQNINVYSLCNEAVVNINTQVTAYDWFLQPYVQGAAKKNRSGRFSKRSSSFLPKIA